MSKTRFKKSFTQQEAIPEAGIERAVEVLRSGRLHRYNVADGETAEAALLEQEFAAYMGQKYCLACASGGYALHVALKAAGMQPGDKVLTNGFTLAPVPGAINNAGGIPVLVEIDEDYKVDIPHLEKMMVESDARFFMMSHMRGHIADMDRVVKLCTGHEVTLIEDCAHTMGGYWGDRKSGTFGRIACFSAQTYKHLNAGEGGLLTSNDDEVMARSIIYSGSYMLYERNGTPPPEQVFDRIKLDTPNYSGRMDNLRAAILRAQLPSLDDNCRRWNSRYQALERCLSENGFIRLPRRPEQETYVGSSLQFRVEQLDEEQARNLVAACAARGVELKWFGAADPHGFTSRYDSWHYLNNDQVLPATLELLSTTFDLRIPLTFDENDMEVIGGIVNQEVSALLS